MSLWDDAKKFAGTTGGGIGNSILGAAATVGGLLPGVGGLVSGIAGIGSGALSTETSGNAVDKGINTAGTVGGIAALPATIAGMLGVNTGVSLGALTSIGSGFGAGAAATGATGAALGGAAVAGNVLAAGAAGYGLGQVGATVIDNYGKGGIFGKDEMTGKDKSAFDVAADAGIASKDFVGKYLGETAGDVAGGAVAGLGSIAMAPVGLAQSAWNGLSSLF